VCSLYFPGIVHQYEAWVGGWSQIIYVIGSTLSQLSKKGVPCVRGCSEQEELFIAHSKNRYNSTSPALYGQSLSDIESTLRRGVGHLTESLDRLRISKCNYVSLKLGSQKSEF
jgi:hypothetical protein